MRYPVGIISSTSCGNIGKGKSSTSCGRISVAESSPSWGKFVRTNSNSLIERLVLYALESSSQPLGISEYELQKLYPAKIEGTMPTIEELENELNETKD